ncbi:hypothetical protein HMPREF1551_00196 [Capnocytophaga sp. oral taxon 863 str. F0517]|nr:hypothetical protein HMPREF1551_00196 [Capnocytophaga sp. oral taxon 863 str. F0517]
MPLGDMLMAAAKGTKALTKRQVYIEANTLSAITFRKRSPYRSEPFFIRIGTIFPIRHRRIAGIARAWYIVFLK